MGRSEERLSRGGAPVDQRPATRCVGEAKPSDVHRLGVGCLRLVCADHAPEPQVQAKATQPTQASRQPVHRHVPVQRLLADAAVRLALSIEPAGQVGDGLLEAHCDGREVLLIPGDQARVGLGRETVWKVNRAGLHGQRLCGMTWVLPQAPRCAIG